MIKQTLISRKISFFFLFAEEDDDDDDIDDEDDQPSTKRQKVEDEANDWFHEKFSKTNTQPYEKLKTTNLLFLKRASLQRLY